MVIVSTDPKVQTWQIECQKLRDENATLRTRLAEVEARLQEAEWLIQNLVAIDTLAATRRDAFLNPTNKDVKSER